MWRDCTSPAPARVARGDLTCPVCHQEFTQPKMLPCTHITCTSCIKAWIQQPVTNDNRSTKGQGSVSGSVPRPVSARSTSSVSSVLGAAASTAASVANGDQDCLRGCPVCKASILPQGQGLLDLEAVVDALPTDVTVVATLESQRVLNGAHICLVCENGVQASSYCLQCEGKLCLSCAQGHCKLPALRNHEIEEISKLTVQRLVEHYLSSCRTHEDRPAEFYCTAHYQLICMLCASTNHRGCPEVKAVAETAKEKREKLKQQAEQLRDREKKLTKQIRDIRDRFKVVRKKVKDAFDEVMQEVKDRRQEVNAQIQAEEDVAMTSLGQMERHRSAVRSYASMAEKMASGAPDVALLDTLGKLTSQLTELEQQSDVIDKVATSDNNILDVVFDQQKLNHLKSSVSSFGRITSTKSKSRLALTKSAAASTSSSTTAPNI